MAIIIDLAHMREVLGSRPGRVSRAHLGATRGEVVLFTGVRYERHETNLEDEPIDAATGQRRVQKKKN